MGGYGSGRAASRAVVEHGLKVDLAWMMRQRLVGEGRTGSGTLHWTCGGEPSGSISYRYDMIDPDHASLTLEYAAGRGEERRSYCQRVPLVYTVPRFGGKCWWMLCPRTMRRVRTLLSPPGADIFAARKAWRVSYASQRSGARDKPFDRIDRMQKRLGCTRGYDMGLRRPKGMWHRTFARLEDRYYAELETADRIMLGYEAIIRGLGRE